MDLLFKLIGHVLKTAFGFQLKWFKSFGLCFLWWRAESREQVFVFVVCRFEEIWCLRILLFGILLDVWKVNLVGFYLLKPMLLAWLYGCIGQRSRWFLYLTDSLSVELLFWCIPKHIELRNLWLRLIFCLGGDWSAQCMVDWVGITKIDLFCFVLCFEERLFG